MSMGRRDRESQSEMWLATDRVARSPGHPFYIRLNEVLKSASFDQQVEKLCATFYSKKQGRPSLPPGVYFRMQLIGYFEGLDSERGIAWRCADSLALREFLGFSLSESTPDHSSLSRIRQRLDVEVHQAVFQLILEILSEHGLLRGKTIGIDATTLEANAALRSIVRRDDGTGYDAFLKQLARESGLKTPTRADLAKLDRKRKGKGSNDDWTNPHDPDAHITKMKDGRTRMGHKSEHAVDMDSGAVLAVTLHGGAAADTQTIYETMQAACEQALSLGKPSPTEWVADKGYHCNATMEMMDELEYRSYISEPRRGRRRWSGKEPARRGTYANRRRIRGSRGLKLLRRRGERVERTFA
ncbi:MAG: transposase, partial [Mesoflavibacter sp.]|nr:transposase [Mesoflavibacter sp.]